MENTLQQGIAAVKAGDKSRAFDLLTRATQDPSTSEQAWLWLSGVVDQDSERLFCLDNVLRINPNNAAAQRGSTMLRQRGVFPAVPVYPEPQRTPSGPVPAADPVPSPTPSGASFSAPGQVPTVSAAVKPSAPPGQSVFDSELKKQELSGLFQYAALELASNKAPQAVEQSLVSRGASLETAKRLVKDAGQAVKKTRQDKYKKRMTRGLILTILGAVITCGTYIFANELGGNYVLCYGAIIFGVIDFVIGLVGWIANG